MKENKDVYKAAFHNPSQMGGDSRYGYLKRHVLEPILKRFGVDETKWKYYIAYYVEGITAIARTWLLSGCEDEVEDLADLIEGCVLKPQRHGKGLFPRKQAHRFHVEGAREHVEGLDFLYLEAF